MTRLVKIGVALCLLMSTTVFAADDLIYKWVNAKGQINYGSNPPPGVKATVIVPQGGPNADDVKAAEDVHKSISGAVSTKASPAPTNPAEAEAKQAACEKAKANYEKLASTSSISIADEQGNYAKASSEKRQAFIEESKAAVDKACAP